MSNILQTIDSKAHCTPYTLILSTIEQLIKDGCPVTEIADGICINLAYFMDSNSLIIKTNNDYSKIVNNQIEFEKQASSPTIEKMKEVCAPVMNESFLLPSDPQVVQSMTDDEWEEYYRKRMSAVQTSTNMLWNETALRTLSTYRR